MVLLLSGGGRTCLRQVDLGQRVVTAHLQRIPAQEPPIPPVTSVWLSEVEHERAPRYTRLCRLRGVAGVRRGRPASTVRCVGWMGHHRQTGQTEGSTIMKEAKMIKAFGGGSDFDRHRGRFRVEEGEALRIWPRPATSEVRDRPRIASYTPKSVRRTSRPVIRPPPGCSLRRTCRYSTWLPSLSV